MEIVNVKAMPGSIPAPKSGWFVKKIRKIQVAKWGKPTKIHLKKNERRYWLRLCERGECNLNSNRVRESKVQKTFLDFLYV